jgi:hypothetical protein
VTRAALAMAAALGLGCAGVGSSAPSYSSWHTPPSMPTTAAHGILAGEVQSVNAFDAHRGNGARQVPELETALWFAAGPVEVGLKSRWLLGPSLPEVAVRYQRQFGRWSVGAAPAVAVQFADADEPNPIWGEFQGHALALQLPILLSHRLSERYTIGFGPKLLYQREHSTRQEYPVERRTAGFAGGANASLYARITPRSALAIEVNGYPVGDRRVFRRAFWQTGLAWIVFWGRPG